MTAKPIIEIPGVLIFQWITIQSTSKTLAFPQTPGIEGHDVKIPGV
jgi:hypothetical protein